MQSLPLTLALVELKRVALLVIAIAIVSVTVIAIVDFGGVVLRALPTPCLALLVLVVRLTLLQQQQLPLPPALLLLLLLLLRRLLPHSGAGGSALGRLVSGPLGPRPLAAV